MNPRNRALVATRWPELLPWLEGASGSEVERVEGGPEPALSVDGVQLASAWAPLAEAELQATLVPAGARRATVYGIGQGHLPRVLLARPHLTSLRVVLLARRVARAALGAGVLEWLDDPRLELQRAGAATPLETPFAASPASLRLADPDAFGLRDRVRLELDAPFVRERLAARTGRGRENLARNAALVSGRSDVAMLFGSRPGGRVLVAGAGPTLEEGLELLRSRPADVPLLAVDAALGPLRAAGVRPDVVVTLDPEPGSLARVLALAGPELAAVPLVWHPASPHEVVLAWPGPRLCARGGTPAREVPEPFRSVGSLWSAGSVLHAAVDLALRTGAARIDLLGADFATPEGRSHAAGAAWERRLDARTPAPEVLDGYGRPVRSLPNLLGYLRELEDHLARHPEVDVVNHGRAGARIAGTRYPEEERRAA